MRYRFLFNFLKVSLVTKGLSKINIFLNLAIFLSIFAISSTLISIYYESKITDIEKKIALPEIVPQLCVWGERGGMSEARYAACCRSIDESSKVACPHPTVCAVGERHREGEFDGGWGRTSTSPGRRPHRRFFAIGRNDPNDDFCNFSARKII